MKKKHETLRLINLKKKYIYIYNDFRQTNLHFEL